MGYPDDRTRKMDDVHGRAVTGGSFPAQIWGRYMGAIVEGNDTGEFTPPDPELLNDRTRDGEEEPPPSSTTSSTDTTTTTTSTTTTTLPDGETTTTTTPPDGGTTTTTTAPSPTTTTTTRPRGGGGDVPSG